MKNLITILLIIPVLVFGQSKFTEATFADFNKKFKANPIETLKNNASEKLIYVLGNGRSSGYQELIAFYGANTENERTFPELTIYQVGNTAVATGVVDHSYFPINNPSKLSHWVGKFTYTYGFEKGKWLLVSAQHTDFQEPFTKETLNEILEEYKTDSKAFFNKYLSSDFRYTNQQGSYQYQKEFLGGTAQSIVATEILQPVIFQSGNLATVSGLHQTIRSNNDGSQQTSHDAATYTFQRRAGKWMFVASQQIPLAAPTAEDETAIKSVLVGETAAFKQNNESKALGYWLNAPYISHYYTAPGLGYVRGDKLITTYKNFLKDHPEIDNSPTDFHDYIIRVNGNAAWATWISEVTSNNKKATVHRASYLEKTNGEWKIASMHSTEAK